MAETVVLIPGLMADARAFQHQVGVLSGRQAVCVAAPVAGERIEEMASALLDVLPQRFALAGHGLGGTVAIEILRRAPERVNRIALISVDPQADTPAMAAERELSIARGRAGHVLEAMEQIVKPEHLAPGPARVSVMSVLHGMAGDLGSDLLIRQLRALQRRRDYQGVLRRIQVPAMVIGGAEDSVMTPKRVDFMANLIPKAQSRLIEGAGGFPAMEHPEALLDALTDWLAQPLVLS